MFLMKTPVRACPFCGSARISVEQEGAGLVWRVVCLQDSCTATGPVGLTRADALLLWEVRITTAQGEPL